jgi:hypothetical protein
MRVTYLAEDRFGVCFACGTENERVFPRWDQSHWDSGIAVAVALLRFQPEAQSWIVNLRLVIPEIWSQPALDEQMVKLELNLRGAPGKIAAHVAGANIEAGDPMTYALRCDNHRNSPLIFPVLASADSMPGSVRFRNETLAHFCCVKESVSTCVRVRQRQQANSRPKKKLPKILPDQQMLYEAPMETCAERD